jgi:hypothetical protein
MAELFLTLEYGLAILHSLGGKFSGIYTHQDLLMTMLHTIDSL